MEDTLCADCGEVYEDEYHVCLLSENEANREYATETVLQSQVQNIEELINEVFKRPPLWNSSLPYEKRGSCTLKFLWIDIDNKLNLYPGTASTKWRNLRDTYVRKLSEQNKYVPSESATTAKPKTESWPYFELMGFLRSTVIRRRTFSNIKPPESSINSSSIRTNNKENMQSSSYLEENVDLQCNIPDSLKQQNIKNFREIKILQSVQPSSNTNVGSHTTPGKRRTNKQETEDLSLLQQSLMSEIKKTDESINHTMSDPVMAFCNYLATQFRTLSQDNFTKCQRKMLLLLFELQGSN